MKILRLITFYYDKKEHYPISDEFIEKYQQKEGGYITYAYETNHLIDASKHEPNQKWHLMESYFITKLIGNHGEINFSNGIFKCPELLLWMAEAAGVDEKIVNEASNYAKERINQIRKAEAETPFSKESVKYMDEKFREKYGKTLWDIIIARIREQ